jgi:tetratricopeptide (TPR) repeat protein
MEPSARTPNRATGAAQSAGNLDLGFSLELEGNSNAVSEAGHSAIPFPGARVASEGLAEAAAAGLNDVPTLAPMTSRGASATRALRAKAPKVAIPKWAFFAGGGGVLAIAAALVLMPLLHSAPNAESVVRPFLPELAKDSLSAYAGAADQLTKCAAEFKNGNAKLRLRAAELILTGLTVHGDDPAKARRAEELLEGISPQPKLASDLGRARALLAIAKGKAREADALLAERTSPESQLILGIARIAEDKTAAAVNPLRQFVAARPGEAVGHYLLGKALAGNAGPEARKEFDVVLASNPAHLGARVGLARLEETPEKRFAAARALVENKPQGAGTTELAELQLLLGQSAQALGRTPEAADAFQRAIGFNRRLTAAHLALGESLLYEGKYAQALERLKTPGPSLEATPAGKFALGGALIATGNGEPGLALLNAAAKELPEDPRGPFWIGFFAATKRPPDLPATEQGYRDAIKRDPKFLPASLKLAALLQQQNKAEDSLAVLRAAEEAGAPPSVLQLAWGEALIVAKEPGKAEEIFRKALAGEPTSISARLGIASALEAQGKLAESRASLEDTLKASPETLGLRERLAQVCLKLGDKTEALAHYQDEIQAGHATPALRLAVARIALDLGKLELVQSEARKVLDEDPRNAEATFLTGRMHEERNEVGAALQEYRHATTWDHLPAYGLAYGRLLAKFGKEHEALLAFESATSLADGRMERGRIYYRRGEMEDALADFQAAGKMTPGEAEPLILQGLCYDKMGQSAKAEESWRAALRADPEAPEPHYRLGRMEMDRGKPAGAVDHFRKAEARVPDKATWRAEMYFQLAQAELLTGSKASALAGFKKYLELAPPDAPARPEATHQVARLATSGKK